ncbi:MAG: hypothetical protein J6U56_09585 [Spirochaetia bacterium]|nr:hypothetical protein [Spirochaetia bacterium]
MKKIILLLLILCVTPCFATLPQKYVKDTYGEKAVFFDEDIEEELHDDKISSRSQIYFYNSTNHDISFEFHEIKTKLGNVTSDKIFPIKGREMEITIKANEYFDSRATNGDIEHFLFVFKDKIYKIYAYTDKLDIQKSDKFSIIFEFADE